MSAWNYLLRDLKMKASEQPRPEPLPLEDNFLRKNAPDSEFDEKRNALRYRRFARGRAVIHYGVHDYWLGMVRLIDYSNDGMLYEPIGRVDQPPFGENDPVTVYLARDTMTLNSDELRGNIIRVSAQQGGRFVMKPQRLPLWLARAIQ